MHQVTEIQSIFNRVIAAGLYGGEGAYSYMCLSLEVAVECGLITEHEYVLAQQNIREYLSADEWADTLAGALVSSDLPSGFEDCLAIYRDWANRPCLGVRAEGVGYA